MAEHTLIGLDFGWELPEDTLRERMTIIMEQADQMVHIIQHVRMFAREAGKPDLSDISVNDAVTSSLDMLGAQFRSHGVKLDVNLTDGLSLVLANQYSLRHSDDGITSNAYPDRRRRRCCTIHS
jgi:C4-dicarboxylate-specific signal transduction histidine kinase